MLVIPVWASVTPVPLLVIQCIISYFCVAGTETTLWKTSLFCHMVLEGLSSIMVGEAWQSSWGWQCVAETHIASGVQRAEAGTRGKHTLILCQSLLLPPSSISHTSALKYFPQPWEISPRARDSNFDTVRTSQIQTMTPHKRMWSGRGRIGFNRVMCWLVCVSLRTVT